MMNICANDTEKERCANGLTCQPILSKNVHNRAWPVVFPPQGPVRTMANKIKFTLFVFHGQVVFRGEIMLLDPVIGGRS